MLAIRRCARSRRQAYKQQKLANRVISLLIDRCNCATRGVYIIAGLKVLLPLLLEFDHYSGI